MVPSHNAPTGAKLDYWLSASRQAFRHFLRSRWAEQECVRPAPDNYLIFPLSDDGSDQDQVGDETHAHLEPIDIARPMRLPWLPKKDVVPELIAIASFAQVLGSRDNVQKLLEPARFTHVIMPLLEEDVGDIAGAFEQALTVWSGRPGRLIGPDHAPKILVSFEAQESQPRYSQSGKQTRSKVEAALRSGAPVILITPSAEIPAQLRSNVNDTFRCSRLTQEVVVEILRALHRAAARLGVLELRKRLPDDDRLGKLTATQLQAALRLLDADALFRRLHNLTARSEAQEALTLEKVRGQHVAVGHLQRMLNDLHLWKTGKLAWSEASMSAVFYGPPGNGKTMLAEAFAGSAGLPLHVTSYSDCQRHGHQGDMLKALNEAFRAAEASVPSVLFIDEIDSFSDRSREHQNEQYLRGVVNGLLMHLTRAAMTPGLVLFAATNDLSVVDPAVIRPGRFDLKLRIGNPDRQGIRDILADHLLKGDKIDLSGDDLAQASAELIGSSGAAVAGKAREAMSRARAAGRLVSRADLLAVIEPGHRSGRDLHLRRLAAHEAGHVIVGVVSGLAAPLAVRIGGNGGVVEGQALPFLTPETAESLLCEILAGRAAERLVLGSVSSGAGEGPDSDLARATSLALRMQTEWCFGPGAPVWQPTATLMSLGLPLALRAAVEDRLARAEAAAEDMLRKHKDALLSLTNRLVEKRELVGDELVSVLIELGLRRPGDNAIMRTAS